MIMIIACTEKFSNISTKTMVKCRRGFYVRNV